MNDLKEIYALTINALDDGIEQLENIDEPDSLKQIIIQSKINGILLAKKEFMLVIEAKLQD